MSWYCLRANSTAVLLWASVQFVLLALAKVLVVWILLAVNQRLQSLVLKWAARTSGLALYACQHHALKARVVLRTASVLKRSRLLAIFSEVRS